MSKISTKLEGILRQHITSQTQTNNRTNKKFNSLTSYSANNDNNNNDDDGYASPSPSIDQSINNNVRGHSVRAATNNNVDTSLDYLNNQLEAMAIQLSKTVTSLSDNNSDDNTTLIHQLIRQRHEQRQQQLSPSHHSNNNSVNSSNKTYVTNNVISSRSFNEIQEADAKRQRFWDFFRGVQN